ncbi:MAG: NAD(P)H-binding protein [Holophagales bacterium]|jgi:uncharacterized protein YbjT (DUF2867 family)|nr:NAD(P)H-binding protein [Holophagales bacterium]
MIFAKAAQPEKIDYSGYPHKNVVVAGATGLVGRELIKVLRERPNAAVFALVRKGSSLGDLGGCAKEIEFDYDSPDHYKKIGGDIPCDALLCALGTTIKNAGSPEAFRKVDLDYPTNLIARLQQLPNKPMFGLVSSVGAGKPKGLYLRTKSEAEKRLIDSELPHLIVRPSLLLGKREEFRRGEFAAKLILVPYQAVISALAPQSSFLWRYAPIEAAKVAEAMARICVDEPPLEQSKILEGLALHHPILL